MQKKIYKTDLIRNLAIVILVCISLLMIYTFSQAFFNGGIVTVNINGIGEMWIETIVLLPIIIASIVITVMNLKEDKKCEN